MGISDIFDKIATEETSDTYQDGFRNGWLSARRYFMDRKMKIIKWRICPISRSVRCKAYATNTTCPECPYDKLDSRTLGENTTGKVKP